MNRVDRSQSFYAYLDASSLDLRNPIDATFGVSTNDVFILPFRMETPKLGITIHYRGTMNDIGQIETMEDRLLDLVFALGGRATIWRSFLDHEHSRIIRGLIVEMEPGQDTFSLLVSPEGHLTPLFQVEDAEKAAFDEPPYCFVKTQFGSLQGHIAIVHILDALRQQYFSDLKVLDEGEYYENRDVRKLSDKMQFLRDAIGSMAEGLRKYGLSAEAAEAPGILATRIERVAMLVHQKLNIKESDPSEPAVNQTEDGQWSEPSLEEEVQLMDRLKRRSDLRSERMTRRIAEATAAGLSADEALELAMREEGLSIPGGQGDQYGDSIYETSAADEPWTESLPEHPFGIASNASPDTEHFAVEKARALVLKVMSLRNDASGSSTFLSCSYASLPGNRRRSCSSDFW